MPAQTILAMQLSWRKPKVIGESTGPVPTKDRSTQKATDRYEIPARQMLLIGHHRKIAAMGIITFNSFTLCQIDHDHED
ncbi:Hypothetical protein NTJ_04724 [Nesidiocoris tenuis]|uniref:Uncharacterized protein n=1 Tax=Nesidiocoris tenuis TaxID=355587 RepID=A0ABN7AI30_9HEMI|nr:Hypothetical protein NTJ_04724 [Nesidiocoris tenuis]